MRTKKPRDGRPPEPTLDKATAKRLKSAGVAVSAPLTGGRWLGVAMDELVVLDGEEFEQRHFWSRAESASWNGDTRQLTVRWVDGAEPLVLTTATDEVYDAVTAVRERITSSQVHVEILPTAGGDVRALIRRGPGGKLFSQLIARGPLTEREQRLADALERQARSAVGMTVE
ncbi:MAG: hypothetical protein Q4G64_04950 [bacterium]|nr:hypothetical protein [bacterium]